MDGGRWIAGGRLKVEVGWLKMEGRWWKMTSCVVFWKVED